MSTELRASDMPTGSTVALNCAYQDLPADTRGTVTGHDDGWAVWVRWNGTARRDFVSCRYLRVVSLPEPVAAPVVTLTLTIDGDEVTVTGTVRGDAVHKSILPRPWVWSRHAGGYVLPRSLTPMTRQTRVTWFRQAAERAGVPVDVVTLGEELREAERREARAERLEARADRHEHAAEKAAALRDASWAASDRISDGIPFGQPILVGHHSQRRAERDRDRIIALGMRGLEADRVATVRAARAEALRRHLERGDSSVTIGNRIKLNEAEIRRIGRSLERHYLALRQYLALRLEAKGKGEAAERVGIRAQSGEWVDRLRAERARLAEAVRLDRAALAARVEAGTLRVYSRDTIRKGDAVKAHGRWHRVARVNGKSVSVETGYSWTDTVPYHRITDHRPATGDVLPI